MGNKQSAVSFSVLNSENLKQWDKIWKDLDKDKSNTLDKGEFAVLMGRILSSLEITKPPTSGVFYLEYIYYYY